MISVDAQVLGHRMPLKPIEFRPVWEAAKDVELAPPYLDQVEANRIWQITRQVAQGCNQPTVIE